VTEISGEYVPSALDWVREQISAYEASGGQQANTLRDTGIPIIVVTMRGARTDNVRKIALMRVEHNGEYALVASYGGAPKNPGWYHNLVAHPDVLIQDGPTPEPYTIREVSSDERATWWARAVAVFPNYAEYQERTARTIPVLVASPRKG
jgi:deazaflavin-dependent oxidoreductase (nitroreductase family)